MISTLISTLGSRRIEESPNDKRLRVLLRVVSQCSNIASEKAGSQLTFAFAFQEHVKFLSTSYKHKC